MTLQDAERSVARKKNLMLAKEGLKFEKSLELASKNLKDAEHMPRADISNEGLNEKLGMVKQPSGINGSTKQHNGTNGHSATNGSLDSVIRRSKPPQRQGLSLPFIQNRDSIHWDAESSEDEVDNQGRPFVDVTETSAFTVVPVRANQVRTNPHISPSDHQKPWRTSNHHSSIPNGKIYTPPKPPSISPPDENKRRELEEQCQKLKELQRHHRLTPTPQSTRAPTNTPNTTPITQAGSYHSTPTSRNPNINGKPVIAPKPQILSNKLTASIKTKNSEQDYNSSTDSDSDHASSETKSTTV